MINKEKKLTVDDLIVEYMMCKIKNGYDPKIYYFEFANFLCGFEEKKEVYDVLYDSRLLFERFIDRKSESDWNGENHIDLLYDNSKDDYYLKANYKFSDFDKSVLNTYFMKFIDRDFIRDSIFEYLSDFPTRIIEDEKISEDELLVGKLISANIIDCIWNSYISNLIDKNMWPKQCRDINKYLLGVDLSEIIGIPSVKEEIIDIYDDLAIKIGNLYHEDKDLKISTTRNNYLAYSNYRLLRDGNEKFFDLAFGFGDYKRNLDIDVDNFKFEESYDISSKLEDVELIKDKSLKEKVKLIVYSMEYNK